MDLTVFQGSLKALTHLFLQQTYSHLGHATWLVSDGDTFLSLLCDMWVLSPAFRKDPSLNLVEGSPLQLPCEAYPGSLERRGEGLLPPVPAAPCHFLNTSVSGTSLPSAVRGSLDSSSQSTHVSNSAVLGLVCKHGSGSHHLQLTVLAKAESRRGLPFWLNKSDFHKDLCSPSSHK